MRTSRLPRKMEMLMSEKVSSSEAIFFPATSVATATIPLKWPAALKVSLSSSRSA